MGEKGRGRETPNSVAPSNPKAPQNETIQRIESSGDAEGKEGVGGREEEKGGIISKGETWSWAFIFLASVAGLAALLGTAGLGEVEGELIGTVVGVQAGISIVTWLQNMLSMRRFQNCRVDASEGVAFLVFLYAGAFYLASTVHAVRRNSELQFVSAALGSLASFVGFLLLFNRRLNLPSPKQFASLLVVIGVSSLWEVRTYIVSVYDLRPEPLEETAQ